MPRRFYKGSRPRSKPLRRMQPRKKPMGYDAFRTATGKMTARYIKKVVKSLTEDKQAYTSIGSGNSLVMFNSGIDSTGDYQPVVPAIGQGVDTNQRIGEKIRAKSLNIRGYVRLTPNSVSNSTSLPQVAVRLMVLSMKNRPNWTAVTNDAAPLQTLLLKGGTTTAFTGILSDLMAPINRDVFTVHADRKFYLKQDRLVGIGASIPSQYIAMDSSKTVRFFNIRVKCKDRILRYDEDISADSYPVNFCPFLVMGYVYLDGTTTPDTLSTNVGLSYISTLTYED